MRSPGPILALTASVLLAGCATAPPSPSLIIPSPGAPAPPGATFSTAPGDDGSVDIVDAGATRVDLTGFADWVAIAGGSTWVAVTGGVRRIDATTGTPGGLIPIPDSICLAMDVGFDSLWAGGCQRHLLARIDPVSGSLDTPFIDLPIAAIEEESSIGAGQGGVWLVSTDHELLRVDPITNRAAGTWPLPAGAAGVRAGLGFVWVAVAATDTLLRIDPVDPRTSQAIKVGDAPRFLAIGEGAVWVMNQGDGTVSRVGAGGSIEATIPVSNVPIRGGDIAVGGGAVWVRIEEDLLVRIDPVTNGVSARFGPPSGSGGVAADVDAVWVTAHDTDSLWRLPLR